MATTNLELLAVGITEAGLASHETLVMQQFFHLVTVLCYNGNLYNHNSNLDDDSTLTTTNNNSNIHCNKKICIINTDNVPGNGTILKQHVLILAKEKQKQQQEQQDQAVDNKLHCLYQNASGASS